MISTGRPARASSFSAGSAQVAMLSALIATEMRSSPRPVAALLGASSFRSFSRSARSSRIILACLIMSCPAGVALSGRLRTMSTVPTCASSARRRCETADCVIDRRWAARSKPPSSTMAARHSRASGSKVDMGLLHQQN